MTPEPIDVSGGAAGIAASCESMRALASRLGGAAAELGSASLAMHAYLLDPAITMAGMARPGEFGCFEGDLADALDGPTGLTWVAAELAALDGLLRTAAAAYEAADSLSTLLRDDVTGLLRLPMAVGRAEATMAATGNPLRALEAVATTDPQLADCLVNLLQIPAHLAALAPALPDGRPVVTATGADTSGPAGTPPRRLRDVVDDLAERNDGAHGAIDVRILTGGGGRRRVIVDITGTKTIDPMPGPDVTGLITDAKALVGARTTYEDGVLEAMRRAGVKPDDDVMLVGHSEGGMVAVTAAFHAVRSGQFRVTHVITAGAPVGETVGRLPRSVQVLALENRGDVVPHLDGVANPDARNITTVTGHRDNASIVDEHALTGSYVEIAADTDASSDRSVRAFIDSAAGYFRATSVETETYVITRRTR